MKPGTGKLQWLPFWILMLVAASLPASAAEVPLRTLLIRELYFTSQTGPGGEPIFAIRARTSVEKLLDKQVTLESTLRRADGSPLRLQPGAPAYLSEQNGVISYSWSGILKGVFGGS